MNRLDVRQTAWRIMQAALDAVDPKAAIANHLQAHPNVLDQIRASTGRVIVVGAGKAGAPMAEAIVDALGDKITAGHVVVKYGHAETLSEALQQSPIQVVEAGHPVPDQAGMDAAQTIAHLLDSATADDVVICLISGGGSALLTLPVPVLNLDDLQATTKSLLAAGASINQVNTIRKHLSQVKGGQLAQRAAPAFTYSLILSDVVGDPLEIIASGPTVPDPSTFSDAWAIVAQYKLQDDLPAAVTQYLQSDTSPETPKADDPLFNRVHNIIVGSNRLAAQAAVQTAQADGFDARLLTTFVEGEAREVGKVFAGLAKGLVYDEGLASRPACLVAGGETTVTLRGSGQGGRNQEMALAAAIALAGWSNVMLACLGTDGTDGPTNAAGAFADGETLSRAQVLGLDALDYLQRNDAYNFFAPLDDLLLTGPTQTNVNDLIIVLAW